MINGWVKGQRAVPDMPSEENHLIKVKEQPEPVFIPVTTNDQMSLVESLAREIWTEHYTPIIGKLQVDYMLDRFQSRQAIADQIKTGVLYFLIQADDAFIGYLAVQPKNDELFLSKIYVRSSLQRKGYGRKAVQFVELLAKERNLGKVVLTVNKNNVTSIKAYEKMGFKNAGSLIQDIGNGYVMDDYKMEKEV
jgi:ribosomal protein S18 acetylase RimI-like enzyme